MSSYGNGKEEEHHAKTGHESFLQFVSQTRLFTDFINSSPSSANVARRLYFWTRKNTKKVTSNPRYFLSIALFQTQKSTTTRSIVLDGSHDFVLASRLNFQHIHYSVFPAVVSSSFHLFRFIGSSRRAQTKIPQLLWFCFRHRISSERTASRTNSQPDDGTRAGGPRVIEGRRALERAPLAVRVRDMTYVLFTGRSFVRSFV